MTANQQGEKAVTLGGPVGEHRRLAAARERDDAITSTMGSGGAAARPVGTSPGGMTCDYMTENQCFAAERPDVLAYQPGVAISTASNGVGSRSGGV
jgi:hypothetical protein